MAELHRIEPTGGQHRQEPPEQFGVEVQVGRALEQDGPELVAQHATALHEVAHVLPRILQLQLVGDALVGLQREPEPFPDLVPPSGQGFLGRESPEGVVDLDGREPRRVVAQPLTSLEVFGVEDALPLVVGVA